MLSGLLYWELFEATRTGVAKAPDAALKAIATERAMLALLNMVVSPRLSIEVSSHDLPPRTIATGERGDPICRAVMLG